MSTSLRGLPPTLADEIAFLADLVIAQHPDALPIRSVLLKELRAFHAEHGRLPDLDSIRVSREPTPNA